MDFLECQRQDMGKVGILRINSSMQDIEISISQRSAHLAMAIIGSMLLVVCLVATVAINSLDSQRNQQSWLILLWLASIILWLAYYQLTISKLSKTSYLITSHALIIKKPGRLLSKQEQLISYDSIIAIRAVAHMSGEFGDIEIKLSQDQAPILLSHVSQPDKYARLLKEVSVENQNLPRPF